MKRLGVWIRIALTNLAIVALLGLIMRFKIMFAIPFLDFKYILHAHSHFAFGGWVTLGLLALMTYRLLPVQVYNKTCYNWILSGILLNAYGMLFSFPFQGYGLYSILFSTTFIFVTYAYTVVFTRDILNTTLSKSVKVLAAGAVMYMALSSTGAFTLAYLLASKSQNLFLYKDAVYTYLHLQYSGFFTLAVFALILHYSNVENKYTRAFAWLLAGSVIPAMFMSYLWHYPVPIIRHIAISGSILTAITAVSFCLMITSMMPVFKTFKSVTCKLFMMAMIAFMLKMIFQALTIIPSLGPLVFSNRPIIIGFLHLVLLGFVSIFILAYCIEMGLLHYKRAGGVALWLFVTGIIINEVVLFSQGLGFMFMISNSLVNWILLGAALCLCSGAIGLAITQGLFPTSAKYRSYNYYKNIKSI